MCGTHFLGLCSWRRPRRGRAQSHYHQVQGGSTQISWSCEAQLPSSLSIYTPESSRQPASSVQFRSLHHRIEGHGACLGGASCFPSAEQASNLSVCPVSWSQSGPMAPYVVWDIDQPRWAFPCVFLLFTFVCLCSVCSLSCSSFPVGIHSCLLLCSRQLSGIVWRGQCMQNSECFLAFGNDFV